MRAAQINHISLNVIEFARRIGVNHERGFASGNQRLTQILVQALVEAAPLFLVRTLFTKDASAMARSY